MKCRRLHGAKNSMRREGRGVTGFVGQPGCIGSFLAHQFHIRRRGAHVLPGDVLPIEMVNEAAMRAKDGFAIHLPAFGDNDGFSSAERQAGERCFVSHPPRETQRIGESLVERLIRPDPRSADRRPQLGAMDRHNAVIAGGLINRFYNPFVLAAGM